MSGNAYAQGIEPSGLCSLVLQFNRRWTCCSPIIGKYCRSHCIRRFSTFPYLFLILSHTNQVSHLNIVLLYIGRLVRVTSSTQLRYFPLANTIGLQTHATSQIQNYCTHQQTTTKPHLPILPKSRPVHPFNKDMNCTRFDSGSRYDNAPPEDLSDNKHPESQESCSSYSIEEYFRTYRRNFPMQVLVLGCLAPLQFQCRMHFTTWDTRMSITSSLTRNASRTM